MPPFPLIAVDVGNARIKLGLFREPRGEELPQPDATLDLLSRSPQFDLLADWLRALEVGEPVADTPPTQSAGFSTLHRPLPTAHCPLSWRLGSVNRPAATRLIDWLRDHRPADAVAMLAADDLPLVVEVARPDMVGVDRLLDAVAANHLRAHRPAVVVDVGSAITVDLVSASGAFLGGAILPGIAMSARALHEFTDMLPEIDMAELAEPPSALGTATVAAMRSGLFWGAVGAVRELVQRLTGQGESQLFLTGGAAPAVAGLMGPSARYVPHLTLAGILLASQSATAG